MNEPEYEVCSVVSLNGGVVREIRTCLHANVAPVDVFTGEIVAHLCLDCDMQLSA